MLLFLERFLPFSFTVHVCTHIYIFMSWMDDENKRQNEVQCSFLTILSFFSFYFLFLDLSSLCTFSFYFVSNNVLVGRNLIRSSPLNRDTKDFPFDDFLLVCRRTSIHSVWPHHHADVCMSILLVTLPYKFSYLFHILICLVGGEGDLESARKLSNSNSMYV